MKSATKEQKFSLSRKPINGEIPPIEGDVLFKEGLPLHHASVPRINVVNDLVSFRAPVKPHLENDYRPMSSRRQTM